MKASAKEAKPKRMRRAVDQLNVVVTCSSRKSAAPLDGLRIRDMKSRDFSLRVDQWIARLRSSKHEDRVQATSLYQGDHWAVVRRLIEEQAAKSAPIRVWIASAGCGLISPQAFIPPYGATFSSNEPDSVAQNHRERGLWWEGLRHLSFEPGAPRTLEDLVENSPESPLLVTGSPEYLTALSGDLERAVEKMKEPERLVILCRQGVRLGPLDEAQVHLNANLSSVVGGSLTSLNARMARWLIDGLGASLTRSTVREAVQKLYSRSKARLIQTRVKSTDQQISDFISDLLSRNSRTSGSAALAAFRESGMAAEQRRFQNLFRAARQEVSVG